MEKKEHSEGELNEVPPDSVQLEDISVDSKGKEEDSDEEKSISDSKRDLEENEWEIEEGAGEDAENSQLLLQLQEEEDTDLQSILSNLKKTNATVREKLKTDQFVANMKKVGDKLTIKRRKKSESPNLDEERQAKPTKKKNQFEKFIQVMTKNRFETPQWIEGG